MTGATALTKSYGYSSIGNLTTKSDVGALVYPVTGVRRHAVQSVTGTVNGLVNPTYEYDTVGNLLREKTGTTIQREITWTGFNRSPAMRRSVVPRRLRVAVIAVRGRSRPVSVQLRQLRRVVLTLAHISRLR